MFQFNFFHYLVPGHQNYLKCTLFGVEEIWQMYHKKWPETPTKTRVSQL